MTTPHQPGDPYPAIDWTRPDYPDFDEPRILTAEEVAVVEQLMPVLAKAAFRVANRNGQLGRRNLFGLSMSGTGGCLRQGAYRLSGTEPSNPWHAWDRVVPAALLGTWIHAGFLPALAELIPGARWEVPTSITVALPSAVARRFGRDAVRIHGSADLWTPRYGGGVVDLKTFGIGKAFHTEPPEPHLDQIQGYSTALVADGVPVSWNGWIYLKRDISMRMETTEVGGIAVGYDPDADGERFRDKVVRIAEAACDPDRAERTESGPGLSVVCDGCPWLNRCWGPDAVPGSPSALKTHDDAELAEANRRYIAVSEQIRELEKQKDLWGAIIGRPESGVYEDTQVNYSKDVDSFDQPEARRLLRVHGIPEPRKTSPGRRFVRRRKAT